MHTWDNSSVSKVLSHNSQKKPLNGFKLEIEMARSGLYIGKFCNCSKSSVISNIGQSDSVSISLSFFLFSFSGSGSPSVGSVLTSAVSAVSIAGTSSSSHITISPSVK